MTPMLAPPNSSMPLAGAVRELAERVHAAYVACDCREDRFTAIAERELARSRLLEQFEPADVYTWAAHAPELPTQLDGGSTFGEPPLTLYWGERFVIDAYTWFSSTTSIHQHAFAGAFGVLWGGSVHTTYRFEEHERINARLQRGKLDVIDVEWLRRGDVRAIGPKRQLIHSLFHLEHPSISIVVRTHRDDEYNPQYSYLHPGASYDPFFIDRLDRRRNEVLRALARVAPERYADVVSTRIERMDLSGAFFAVQAAYWALLEHAELFAAVRAKAIAVHGERLIPYLACIDRMLRDRHLTNLRKKITDPDLRTFVALLLNVPTGDRILRLLEERYPGVDPSTKAAELTIALSREAKLGFSLDGLQSEIFTLALKRPSFEDLIAQIKASYEEEEVDRARPRSDRFLQDLAAQPIISPLFA